jgi:MFS family permease
VSQTLSPLRLLASPFVRTFYVWAILSKVSLLTPFFALFLAHRLGVTTSTIAMLFATYSAVRFVTEVPLGILADRVGETITLQFSSVVALGAIALLAFGPLPALFVGQALFAISESASSGAQQALLYRVCAQDRSQDWISYQEAEPAFTSAAWSGVVCAGFLGTLVVWWSMDALGPASVMIAGLACAASLCLPILPLDQRLRKREILSVRELAAAIWQRGTFQLWFWMGAIVAFVLSVTYFTIQPLLNERDLAGPANGILYSAVTAFAAYAAHITNSLNNRFSTLYQALLAGLGMLTLAILFLFWADSLIAIFIAMAGLRFAWGWLGATSITALNTAIPIDEMRATILSVQALLTNVFNATALAGFASLRLLPGSILLVLAVVVAAAGSIMLFVVIRKRGDTNAV